MLFIVILVYLNCETENSGHNVILKIHETTSDSSYKNNIVFLVIFSSFKYCTCVVILMKMLS